MGPIELTEDRGQFLCTLRAEKLYNRAFDKIDAEIKAFWFTRDETGYVIIRIRTLLGHQRKLFYFLLICRPHSDATIKVRKNPWVARPVGPEQIAKQFARFVEG